MCGRYNAPDRRDLEADELVAIAAAGLDEYAIAGFINCAPTMTPAVLLNDQGQRVIEPLRWGLVPSWAKDEAIGNRMINARAETVAEKPAYRAAFKSRRCAVPMRGYYEWRKEGKVKQPYYFTSAEGGLLWIAGLWEQRGDLRTFCVITTDANALTAQVHDRMPVLLDRDDVPAWLGEQDTTPEQLQALLKPCDPDTLAAWPVSRDVNKPGNQGTLLTEPVGQAL